MDVRNSIGGRDMREMPSSTSQAPAPGPPLRGTAGAGRGARWRGGGRGDRGRRRAEAGRRVSGWWCITGPSFFWRGAAWEGGVGGG